VKALWLTGPLVAELATGNDPESNLLASDIASTRLRIGVAAAAWKRAGNQNMFLDPQNVDTVFVNEAVSADICVVPKFFHNSMFEQWFKACTDIKRAGVRLVVDICDFPFHGRYPAVVRFYEAIFRICDAVTVNTEKMGELIQPYSTHRPHIIADAIIGHARKPEFMPGKRLELLWYGNPVNLPYLASCLDTVVGLGAQRRCQLTLVTKAGAGGEELALEIERQCAPRFGARFTPWSLDAMRIELRKCDLVLVPSDPSDPFKAGASTNRVAEALQAGRLPVASPLQSYSLFSEAAWLGHDLARGVEWALANRGEVLARIRRGQAQVAEHLAQEKIGRQWRELFESVALKASHSSAGSL